MASSKITKGFVLAAGRGTRMCELTAHCPKPLLQVAGRSMLNRAIDALEEAGVEEVVVNTHYLAPMIEEHLRSRTSPRIILSHETERLETAGGVLHAIRHFGEEPFFVLNADVVWTDHETPSLQAMQEAWDSERMDLMLLVHPVETAYFYKGEGDYLLEGTTGTLHFAKGGDAPVKPNTVFAGPRIVHPRLFEGVAPGERGFLELFHKAEAAGRLYGYRHSGEWFHVGTPEALVETNRMFAEKRETTPPSTPPVQWRA